MACATCLRRNKPCDERRPRCGTCKASHLRCVYPRPPGVFTFVNESAGQSPHRTRGHGTEDYTGSPSQPPESPTPILNLLPQTTASSANRNPAHPMSDTDRPRSVQNNLAGILPSPWHDDFYYDFSKEPFQDINLDVDVGLSFPLDGLSSQTQPADDSSSLPITTSLSREDDTPAATTTSGTDETPDATPLPGHILAQHYSSELARKYSFKSPEWTFYTYFFHRFTQSHPWVLCSIQAWTSTHLYYSGKLPNVLSAVADYLRFVDHMKTHYGVSHEDFGQPRSHQRVDPVGSLADATPDDIDAIFVGHFFLALADLMAARPLPFRSILRFIAHLLQTPGIKGRMTGVRSRVASWVCILS
jgi:hypothetical protein